MLESPVIVSSHLDLLDSSLLKDVEDYSIRRLKGSRNMAKLLKLVHKVSNVIDTLKSIKHWAKCCSVYSNRLAFLCVISWTIIVTRVCQLLPEACAATLFCHIYSKWKWTITVLLKWSEKHTIRKWS